MQIHNMTRRGHWFTRTSDYRVVDMEYERYVHVQTCAGTTTRLLKLPTGREHIQLVLTKTKPRGHFMEFGKYGRLVNSVADLEVGARRVLSDAYETGHRFVHGRTV